MAEKKIALTPASGPSWTVPLDWNNANNKIEGIGAGGDGIDAISPTVGTATGAGGGGAYASVTNIQLTPGSTVFFRIGGGSTIDTWFNKSANVAPTTTTDGILAKTGERAVDLTGGLGGSAAASIGEVTFSGGNGGNGFTGLGSGGGGGAAGPGGAGRNGGDGDSAGGGQDAGGGGGGAGGASSTAGAAGGIDGGDGGAGPDGTGGGTGGVGANGGNGSSPGAGGGGGDQGFAGGFGAVGTDLGTVTFAFNNQPGVVGAAGGTGGIGGAFTGSASGTTATYGAGAGGGVYSDGALPPQGVIQSGSLGIIVITYDALSINTGSMFMMF